MRFSTLSLIFGCILSSHCFCSWPLSREWLIWQPSCAVGEQSRSKEAQLRPATSKILRTHGRDLDHTSGDHQSKFCLVNFAGSGVVRQGSSVTVSVFCRLQAHRATSSETTRIPKKIVEFRECCSSNTVTGACHAVDDVNSQNDSAQRVPTLNA